MNYIFLSLLTSSGSDLLFSTVCQGSIHNLPRGWAMMILRGGGGHSFSLLWFSGGYGKFPAKITLSMGAGGGGATIFFLKKKRKWKYAVGHSYNSCLLFHFDKMLIQNYSMKLDAWRPLLVLQGLFVSGSNSLLTAWPVVMQWFNEDH